MLLMPTNNEKMPTIEDEKQLPVDPVVSKDLQVANIKLLAVVGYIGLLFLVPMLAYPKNKFAIFHANQWLLLLLTALALHIAMPIISIITFGFWVFLWPLVWLFIVVLFVLGAINASKGRMRRLPLIGKWDIIELQK